MGKSRDPVAEAFRKVLHAQEDERRLGWTAVIGVVLWLVLAGLLLLLWPEAFTNH